MTEDQEIKELSNSNEVYSHEEEIYSVEIGKRRKRLPLMDQREREIEQSVQVVTLRRHIFPSSSLGFSLSVMTFSNSWIYTFHL